MIKISIVIWIVILNVQPLVAQEAAHEEDNQVHTSDSEQAKNVIYLELGGAGVHYTFNYERRFTEHLRGRVGAGYFPLMHMTSVPIGLNYQSGSGAWRMETSMGIAFLYMEPIFPEIFVKPEDHEQENFFTVNYTPGIGLRYQPGRYENRDLFFRVAFTPHIAYNLEGIAPWAGISFGIAF
jgi:hypothetical protein